jgi:hypothetical protein
MMNNRFMSFVDVHGCLDPNTEPGQLQEIIRACPYPCRVYHFSDEDDKKLQHQKVRALNAALYRSSSYLYDRKLLITLDPSCLSQLFFKARMTAILTEDDDQQVAIGSTTSSSGFKSSLGGDDYMDEIRKADSECLDSPYRNMPVYDRSGNTVWIEQLQEHAAITIQLWFRSWVASRLALIVTGIVDIKYFKMRLSPGLLCLSKKQKKRIVAFQAVFTILSISYMKGKRSLRDYVYHAHDRFIRVLLQDVILNVLDTVQRERLALVTMQNMSVPTTESSTVSATSTAILPSSNVLDGSLKKAISSRLLRPFAAIVSSASSNIDNHSISPLRQVMECDIGGKDSVSNRHSSFTTTATTEGTSEVGGEMASNGKAVSKSSQSFTRRMMSGFMGGK